MGDPGEITTDVLKLSSGSIHGGQNIRSSLAQVKRDWTAMMVAKIEAHFPNTKIPYRTGNMFFTFIATLRSSLYQAGSLKLGAPGVEYAGYVNDMNPPVTWTGGGNRYQWFEKVLNYYDQIKIPTLRETIKNSGLALAAGQSVTALATALGADV
jgi:hypothetical protein